MRTLAVWCPDWPVVAARVPVTVPAAVIAGGEVLACSPAARLEGVRRGMRRRDAQSRCPELTLLDHRPELDARAFEEVLAAIEDLTPGVAPLRPGLCALRVPPRYHGGERETAAVIAERVVELGLWDVRLGIADGMFAAEQASRRALTQDVLIVAPGGSADFLADLPVEAADDTAMVDLLRRLGVRTLGAFASLAAGDVRTRFGDHGMLLHRLARGEDPHPISRRSMPPEFTAGLTLEPPVELVEPIVFSLRRTAESFVQRLADHQLVCTAVTVEVDADGALASSRTWRHPRWFSSVDLLDRVRWQLQGTDTVRAPVDAVRLVPEETHGLGEHAESLFGSGPDAEVERGVARVQSLLGHDAVQAVAVQGGRGPADRQRLVPWGERDDTGRPAGRPWPGRLPAPAPATVFDSPPAAVVVGAEGQPVGVSGRGAVSAAPARFRATADGDWQPVASWAGPWPVDERWWDEAGARRLARFQVVGVDGSAWLMVVEGSRWWTEARYD
ncbi:ImpB/MucB/SamB family protein [Aeromicrobium marinum DSM 15272]|uniref:ImpB/MucB/SamB family protein n=1 Tax=Aeromicrobium marinum DSM 15272 TaxID=585531 RepID=E2SCV8_9ACTN|nr:DNA polymerase Y family protein [Aeromicrobium marinum]EFQ83061.1 ImpB/MucB/SamB family protein [Aeromicrobium marinum DSM 15272]